MLSFLCTATAAILLALNHQASGMTIPQIPKIYDYGGLFAENICQLKSIPDVTCYLEWIANQGWVKKTCPLGTKFIEKSCQCLAVPKNDGELPVKSNQTEPAHKQGTPSSKGIVLRQTICPLKPAADRASYLELVKGQGFFTRTCPAGTAFNAQRCGCTTIISDTIDSQTKGDNSDEETSRVVVSATKEAPTKKVVAKKEVSGSKIPCTKKTAEKSTFYMELVQGHGWMTRPCSDGTIFNAAECECLEEVGVAGSIDDSPKPDDANEKKGSQDLDDHLKDKIAERLCMKIADFDQDFYLQLIVGEHWVRFACAEGTIYSAEHCQCVEHLVTTPKTTDSEEDSDSSEETDETTTTSEPCNMKADTVGNRYLELVQGHGWMSRPCPEGTAFTAENCRCTSTSHEIDVNPEKKHETDDNTEKKHEPTTNTAPCTRKPSHTETLYLQMVPGDRWVLMKCAEDTVYNEQTCGCTLPTDGDDSSDESSEEDNMESTTVAPSPEHETDSDEEIVCNKKPADHITRYQELVEGFGWIIRDCAKGTGFDPTTCTCSETYLIKIGDGRKVTDTTAVKPPQKEKPCDSVIKLLKKMMSTQFEEDKIPDDAFCLRKPSMNPQIYLEISGGVKWVTRVCPRGTVFVLKQCRCSSPFSLFGKDVPDKDTSGEVVDGLGQRLKDGDMSLYEKMLAQKIFEQWNRFQLKAASHPKPSFYPHQSKLATRPPTQSKYVTVQDPNFRIF